MQRYLILSLFFSELTVAAEINELPCVFSAKYYLTNNKVSTKDVMLQLAMWVVSVIAPEAS